MTIEDEISKIKEAMRQFEEVEDQLQADYYVKLNKAKEPEAILPSDEAIQEKEQQASELAKEIALSLMRLKRNNSKIVIIEQKCSELFGNDEIFPL